MLSAITPPDYAYFSPRYHALAARLRHLRLMFVCRQMPRRAMRACHALRRYIVAAICRLPCRHTPFHCRLY